MTLWRADRLLFQVCSLAFRVGPAATAPLRWAVSAHVAEEEDKSEPVSSTVSGFSATFEILEASLKSFSVRLLNFFKNWAPFPGLEDGSNPRQVPGRRHRLLWEPTEKHPADFDRWYLTYEFHQLELT